MAQIGERWLMQQIDGMVVLFERYTERELVRFDPSNADLVARTQKVIFDLPDLNDEEKCFAHFWSGYFYAHATGV